MLHSEGFHDNPNRLAFLHGPLVLCGPIAAGSPVPAIVTEPSQMLAGLQPVAGRSPRSRARRRSSACLASRPGRRRRDPRAFVQGARQPALCGVLGPLHATTQWQVKETEYAAELCRSKELESRTVDLVNPGRGTERAGSQARGRKIRPAIFGNRGWRHADDGGYFRYVMNVLPDQPQELSVTYWGSDAGRRVFDILVDGKKLATETLGT